MQRSCELSTRRRYNERYGPHAHVLSVTPLSHAAARCYVSQVTDEEDALDVCAELLSCSAPDVKAHMREVDKLFAGGASSGVQYMEKDEV